MDIDRLKRLILFCLVVVGFLVAERSVQAAADELAKTPPIGVAEVTAEGQREPRQRKLQFRARLLKHWWQPRTGASALARRPIITKII